MEETEQAKLQALFAGAPHLNRLTVSQFYMDLRSLCGVTVVAFRQMLPFRCGE